MSTDRSKSDDRIAGQDHAVDREKIRPQPVTAADKDRQPGGETDRPGFDLGGAKGDQEAGRGLGLGSDAKDGREEQRLPRGDRGDQTSGSGAGPHAGAGPGRSVRARCRSIGDGRRGWARRSHPLRSATACTGRLLEDQLLVTS